MGRVGGGCVVVSVRCGQAVPLLLRCRVPASSGPGLCVSLCQVCVCGDRSVRPTGDEHSVHGGPRRREPMQHRMSDYRVDTYRHTSGRPNLPSPGPTSIRPIPSARAILRLRLPLAGRRARRRVSPSVASVASVGPGTEPRAYPLPLAGMLAGTKVRKTDGSGGGNSMTGNNQQAKNDAFTSS